MNRKFYYGCLLTALLLSTGLPLLATIYEAEEASLYHAVTEVKNSGFTGDSYVNFDNETGSYIEFTVSMAESGEQTLTFRYANNGTSARPMSVSLEGNSTGQTLTFSLTGDWTNWQTESIVLDLPKGISKLRLTSAASEGGPNLDNMEVSGTPGSVFNLNISINGPGTVITNPEGSSFYEGESVTLTASTGLFGEFTGWSGDLTGTASTAEVLMDGDKNITASFNEIQVEVPEPDFDMKGFATVSGEGYTTTTGGEGGTVSTVSTLEELLDFASSRENETTPAILYIRGKITAASTTVVTIKHGANITILGEGSFGELENVGLNIRDYNNVIIRNMKIHEVFYPNDAITIDECQHVWVDHNELYSKIGDGIGVDTYDGLLDIKNGSRYVTVSWNLIHHHMKTSLIGHTDSESQASTDSQFRITYHHNYFHDTDGRNPSIRFGAIHLYNNYFENISDYGIAVRQGAHAKLDNNHYHSVLLPISTNKFDGPDGYVCESGTVYTGTCSAADNSITQTDCDFWNDLPYSYSPEESNTVALSVSAYAGTGIITTGEWISLASISVSAGELDPAFNSNITHYTLTLPYGTTDVEIFAACEQAGAVITGEGLFSTFPSTAEITVSSADGTMSETYTIDLQYAVRSSDARLASLNVDKGSLEPGFSPEITSYQLAIPEGSTSVLITAETEDDKASVDGSGEFTDIPGIAELTVTAEDGTSLVYSINISFITGRADISSASISCYPNPVSDRLWISTGNGGRFTLYDLNGRLLQTVELKSNEEQIDMSGYKSGLYIVRISTETGTSHFRILKK